MDVGRSGPLRLTALVEDVPGRVARGEVFDDVPLLEPPARELGGVDGRWAEGPRAVEPPDVVPPVLDPPDVEPPDVEPPDVEPPDVEPPVEEPPVEEPPVEEPPVEEPPDVERSGAGSVDRVPPGPDPGPRVEPPAPVEAGAAATGPDADDSSRVAGTGRVRRRSSKMLTARPVSKRAGDDPVRGDPSRATGEGIVGADEPKGPPGVVSPGICETRSTWASSSRQRIATTMKA